MVLLKKNDWLVLSPVPKQETIVQIIGKLQLGGHHSYDPWIGLSKQTDCRPLTYLGRAGFLIYGPAGPVTQIEGVGPTPNIKLSINEIYDDILRYHRPAKDTPNQNVINGKLAGDIVIQLMQKAI